MDRSQMKQWKIKNLDSKSPSFCGAKWYNGSIWLSQGWTTSCHHNPPHAIDPEAIKTNPRALHNTEIKKNERRMMQQGLKPVNCQFCWVMEEVDPDGLSDRAWTSWGQHMNEQQLNAAFTDQESKDYDLTYLEIVFDRTCQLACSYCAPSISSTWARDIRRNGAYENLPSDHRQHYTTSCDDMIQFEYGDQNPYADAFFRWWDESLHKTIKQIRISGGEPMMSGHTWKLLKWLSENSDKADCRIEMTTNLAYDADTLNRFLDMCSKISSPIWVYTSGETTECKMEYIRDGIEWEQWNRNIDAVLHSGVIANTGICGTISATAADGFTEFLYWLLDRKKNAPRLGGRPDLMLSVNPVRFPTFQNIVVLPLELRQQYSKDIQDFLSRPDVNEWFLPIEIDHIERFGKYLTNCEVPHREKQISYTTDTYQDRAQDATADLVALQKDFRSFFQQYDVRRNKCFEQTFPRLADWYRRI